MGDLRICLIFIVLVCFNVCDLDVGRGWCLLFVDLMFVDFFGFVC